MVWMYNFLRTPPTTAAYGLACPLAKPQAAVVRGSSVVTSWFVIEIDLPSHLADLRGGVLLTEVIKHLVGIQRIAARSHLFKNPYGDDTGNDRLRCRALKIYLDRLKQGIRDGLAALDESRNDQLVAERHDRLILQIVHLDGLHQNRSGNFGFRFAANPHQDQGGDQGV